MFEPDSRYAPLRELFHDTPDGRRLAYKARRFLPQGSKLPLLTEAVVEQADRLDLVAWRTLGKPELSWRIADANDAMDPATLTAVPGRRLRVALPRVRKN